MNILVSGANLAILILVIVLFNKYANKRPKADDKDRFDW